MSENGVSARNKTTVHKLVEYFGAITVPGCYDALSVKILQQAGHQAALVSGAAVSATQLGEPDLGLLTAPEMVRRTTQICNSVPTFPVIADIESGGGGVLNVQRTIKSLMAAGARGCIIEDQAWPKRTGTIRSVLPKEEFVSKIAAAREIIGESDFFLIARTDARSTSAKRGLEDAMIRANYFVDAGADAHLIGGLRSVDELRIVGENTTGMRVANMVEGGVTPICSTAQLQGMGFNIVCYPLSSLYAATRALVEVYGGLAATGTSQNSWEDMVSWRAFQDILGLEGRYASEEHFNSVQGPTSNIEKRLRAKVKGLVKPHSPEH
jgi:2-methylisocitrate lyase-like PEP mutase family enzyme